MGSTDLIRRLSGLPGFGALPDESVRLLAGQGMERTYRKDMSIHYQGEKAETARLILSGKVRRIKYRSDQSTMELGTGEPGDWTGVPEIFVTGPFLSDCLPSEETTVLAYGRAAFLRFMNDPGIRNRVLQALSRDFYRVHSQIEAHTPVQRMARLFLARVSAGGVKPVEMPVTQEGLADLIGFTRETTNKNLKKLEALGLIAVGRGRISILDADGLKKLMSE